MIPGIQEQKKKLLATLTFKSEPFHSTVCAKTYRSSECGEPLGCCQCNCSFDKKGEQISGKKKLTDIVPVYFLLL